MKEKNKFIKINDERILLSSIKRYFPTKYNQPISKSLKSVKQFSLTLKLSVTKDADSYVYKFDSQKELDKTLAKLDKHFNII